MSQVPLLIPNHSAKKHYEIWNPCFVLLAWYLHPMPDQQHQHTESTNTHGGIEA